MVIGSVSRVRLQVTNRAHSGLGIPWLRSPTDCSPESPGSGVGVGLSQGHEAGEDEHHDRGGNQQERRQDCPRRDAASAGEAGEQFETKRLSTFPDPFAGDEQPGSYERTDCGQEGLQPDTPGERVVGKGTGTELGASCVDHLRHRNGAVPNAVGAERDQVGKAEPTPPSSLLVTQLEDAPRHECRPKAWSPAPSIRIVETDSQ